MSHFWAFLQYHLWQTRDHGRVALPRMTDRVYGSDDSRSGYHTCGPTLPPAVIDRYFVKHHLLWTPPLILIVYSRLDWGIQSATEMLPLKRGRVLHIVLTAFVDMHLADALVSFNCSVTSLPASWSISIAKAYIQPQSQLKPLDSIVPHRIIRVGTLTVDGWAVIFGTARRGVGRLRPHPVSSSLYQM